jgi:hypothetical protein
MGNPDLDKQKGPGGWTLRQIRTLVRLDASRQTLDRRIRVEYSTERPHSSRPHSARQWMAPTELARQCDSRDNSANLEEPEISTLELP